MRYFVEAVVIVVVFACLGAAVIPLFVAASDDAKAVEQQRGDCVVWEGNARSELLHAIEHVESGCRPDAVGARGEVGILQITPIMVEEVNRILDLSRSEMPRFTLADRENAGLSEQMFWIYSDFWCEQTQDYSPEGIARRWNGGPRGHRKPATEQYWRRVKAQMPEADGASSGG